MRIKLSTPKEIAKKNNITVQAVHKWIETGKFDAFVIPSKGNKEHIYINPNAKYIDSKVWYRLLRALDNLSSNGNTELGFVDADTLIVPELLNVYTPEEFAEELSEIIENAIKNGSASSVEKEFQYKGYYVVAVPSKRLIRNNETWIPYAVITSPKGDRELIGGSGYRDDEHGAYFISAQIARDTIDKYLSSIEK